jgi:cation diffusion facilitator family transporter
MERRGEHRELLKRGQKVAITATIIIFLLAVAKFIIGYLFESRILIADAYHSGVDVFAIFASWFGLRLASRKKSTKFPYGLYRAETFVTLVIGAFITWAGIENLLEGYGKLYVPAPEQAFPLLPVMVSGFSVIVSFVVAKMERQAGTSINSGALKANASEAFLDIGTSLVVLAGILLAHARIPYIEGLIVMFIAVLIIRLGIMNIWTPMLILLDANLDPRLQEAIEDRISGIDGVKRVHDVKIRQSGPFRMVECNIATKPSVSVFKAHELANMVEKIIEAEYSEIESVFVHVEPVRQHVLSAIVPVREMNGMDSRVHGHFGRAPYFMILKLDDAGTAEIEDFYYNEFLEKKDRIHIAVKVIKVIIKHDLDIVFTTKIGEIAFHMLKDNFIDIFGTEEGITVNEVVKNFREGKLQMIASPHPAEESEIRHVREDSK